MNFNQLTWGVKASFRSYVASAEGTITLSDGAAIADDGAFIFFAEAGGNFAIAADGTASGSMRFKGTVTFEAHGGMLKVAVSELGLEAGEEGLVLTAPEGPLNQRRCAIAELGPVESGVGGVVMIASQITIDGMYQIADNYPPGTALDPLILA
jgi:hypothetical protein